MNFAYLGEIAALSTAVCWSLTALFFSFSGRRIGPLVVSQSRLLFALVMIAATHWITLGTLWPTAEPFRWGWLGLSSFLGLVVGDTLLFYAYATLGPRLSMLLMSLVPIINTAAGWILFDERMAGWELPGVFLTVFGIAWVVTEKRGGKITVPDKQYGIGLLCGIGGATGQAANLITARYGLVGGYSTLSATLIRIFVAVIFLWAWTAWRGKTRSFIRQWRDRPALKAMIAGTVVGPFLGIWFSLIAIQNAPLGIASTLMALPPVLLIPLEAIIERKPASPRSVLGTLTTLAGVALILLT